MQTRYSSKIFQSLNPEAIKKIIINEGFRPIIIKNDPFDKYPTHTHPETKLLVFLTGTMTVSVGDKTYECGKGDKLIIAGNTKHSAVVGENGCTFYWSEKVL